jgi:hypothetical protein
MILDVALEVIGEAIDPRREERDLDFRRAGVAGLALVGLD